jgi:hypothetical protein
MTNSSILNVDDLFKPENIEYLDLLSQLDLLNSHKKQYRTGATYFLDTLRMVGAYGEPVLDPTTKQNLKNNPTCLLTAYFACSAPALEFLKENVPANWQVVNERQKEVRYFFEITEKYRLQQDGLSLKEIHALTQKLPAFQDTIHSDFLAAEFKVFLENRGNDPYR